MNASHAQGCGCAAPLSPSGLGEFKVVAPGLRWLLEPLLEADVPGVRRGATPALTRSLVHTCSAERRTTWLTSDDLEHWAVSAEEAERAADEGLDQVLEGLTWRPRPVARGNAFQLEGRTLFRASVLYAPSFVEQAGGRLGPHLFAVAPTPEKVIVFDDLHALGTLGPELHRGWARAQERLSLEVLAHEGTPTAQWRVAGALEPA